LKDIENLRPKDKEIIMALAAQSVGAPGDLYRELIKDLSRQRMEVIARREALTAIIEKEVAAHPYGSILLSFPCFGAVAAAAIIGVVKDIDRWPNKKKLKKAWGVYGKLNQSGTAFGKIRQGKEGNGLSLLFKPIDRRRPLYYIQQQAR
jgi:transposase